MLGKMLTFNAAGEDYPYYVSPSLNGKGPGVVVIQEWWGLVDHIKRVADRFAQEGFTALAPDLFRGDSTTDPDDAATKMQALHIANTEQVLRKAVLTLLARPEVVGDRVGVVGFCMGGQLALYAASSNPVVGACVDFYGIHPNVRPVLRDLNGPVLGIFAENDTYASPDVVKQLDTELTLLERDHSFVTYPGTQHAFFNDDRPEVYNREASEDAWRRTIEFLRTNLSA